MSRFLCLSFFAAAKKVSAAPHRGNANRPLTIQEMAPNPEPQNNHDPERGNTNKQITKLIQNNKKRQYKKTKKPPQNPSPAGPNHIPPHNAKKIQTQTPLHEMQKTAHFPT
ncbi:hypothetical protein [Paraburkholderia caffeinilytica]|uniref:hypothetical protein n=1 Tax=Paraburkholderia caffeinilytica TaxID=1761016 RepID=UPI0013BE987A|nr:hypothetical protein [Paraburkholderia caffeinilytica]